LLSQRLGAKRPRLLILKRRRGWLVLLLLAGVLLFLAPELAQLMALRPAEPALRLQFLQSILLNGLRFLRLRIVLLRVLPLTAAKRAQLAPFGATQLALRLLLLRLQLLQARALDGLLLRSGFRRGGGRRSL